MKAPFEKISYYLFFALLIIEAVFLAVIWNSKHEDISFKNEALDTLDNGWTYTDADGNTKGITLPVLLGRQKIIKISRIMPSYIQSNWVLSTLSTHKCINVYLDNRLVYNCWADNSLPFELSPGSMWDIINLPAEAADKLLTLEIIPEHNYASGTVNEVYIGSKAAFMLHILETKGFNLFLSMLIFLIGIDLVVIYLFLFKYLKKNKSMLFLGLFSVMVSLWMLMESGMMQFFLDNRYLITTIKYIALQTLPIPILYYISSIDNFRYKKQVMIFNYIFIINAAVMILLQITNVLNFHDGLLLLHSLMVVIFSILFIQLFFEVIKYNNRSLRCFIYSFGILFFFAMIEIITYNFNLNINTGSFLQFGVLGFLIILSLNSLKKITEIAQLNEYAKQYEYLATRDYMTKCKNRNAYSTALESVARNKSIAVILADINNTKYINDTYGHHAGDYVIVRCSQCLLSVIGNDEYCYRIGGDEFVCLIYDQSEKYVRERIAAFFKECEEVNVDCPYPFEVSIGYAFYDKSLDKDIYDTVKRADREMYRNKTALKFSSL